MEKRRFRYNNETKEWDELFTCPILDSFIYIDAMGRSQKLPGYLYDTYKAFGG